MELEDTTVEWKFLKYVQEPEFGPGLPVKTVYITGTLGRKDGKLTGLTDFTQFMFDLSLSCIDMNTAVVIQLALHYSLSKENL